MKNKYLIGFALAFCIVFGNNAVAQKGNNGCYLLQVGEAIEHNATRERIKTQENFGVGAKQEEAPSKNSCISSTFGFGLKSLNWPSPGSLWDFMKDRVCKATSQALNATNDGIDNAVNTPADLGNDAMKGSEDGIKRAFDGNLRSGSGYYSGHLRDAASNAQKESGTNKFKDYYNRKNDEGSKFLDYNRHEQYRD